MPANARSVVRALAGILGRYSLALALRVLIKSTQFRNFIHVSVNIVAVPVAAFGPYAIGVLRHQLDALVKFPRFSDARQRMKHFPIRCMSGILREEIALMGGRLFVYVSDIVSGFALAG
jgi:hypothetical protein